MSREPRQHPKGLRAKFKHYASRIRAIPPGGKMPAALIADARRMILERMALITGEPTSQELRADIVGHHAETANDGRVYLVSDEHAGTYFEDYTPTSRAYLVDATPDGLLIELRRKFDCTPRELSRPYSTDGTKRTKAVHTHQTGAEE